MRLSAAQRRIGDTFVQNRHNSQRADSDVSTYSHHTIVQVTPDNLSLRSRHDNTRSRPRITSRLNRADQPSHEDENPLSHSHTDNQPEDRARDRTQIPNSSIVTPPNSTADFPPTDPTRTDCDQIAIPDIPSKSALGHITPLPDSWQATGRHHATRDHDIRLFAIGYDRHTLPDAFRVRYIHPKTSHTQYQRFDATEWRPDAHMPTIFTSDTESFPVSYGVTPESKGFVSPPSDAERQLLWAIHDDYLKSHTEYHPPETVTHD